MILDWIKVLQELCQSGTYWKPLSPNVWLIFIKNRNKSWPFWTKHQTCNSRLPYVLIFMNIRYHGLIQHDFGHNMVKSWTPNKFSKNFQRGHRHKKFTYFCSYGKHVIENTLKSFINTVIWVQGRHRVANGTVLIVWYIKYYIIARAFTNSVVST